MKTLTMLIAATMMAALPPVAQEQKPPRSDAAPSVHQEPARESYRLDYTITETEDGKKVNARTYTLMCEDRGISTRGVLKIGSRVPIVTGTPAPGGGGREFTYLDLGINIEAWLDTTTSNEITLASTVEMSSAADSTINQASAPVIRQLKVSANNAVAIGKPVVIATADDVASHRQFQIQVVATRLK
ncbi:MAG TPA: hypothetical protein VE998_01715 [Terriglobales bacterium]|nr:hypothetical protein [Terriglobales bacterium]